MMNNLTGLVGKKVTFDDGDSIEVIQIKSRSEDPLDVLVTVHIKQGPGIPRKLVFNSIDFKNNYGHLFGISEPPEGASEPFDSI
jgi:hypothetical protein